MFEHNASYEWTEGLSNALGSHVSGGSSADLMMEMSRQECGACH